MTSFVLVEHLTSSDLVPGKCYCFVKKTLDLFCNKDFLDIFMLTCNDSGQHAFHLLSGETVIFDGGLYSHKPFIFVESVTWIHETDVPISFLKILHSTGVGYIQSHKIGVWFREF